MKKSKLLMITSCLLFVGLVGCAGNDTSTTSTPTKPSETSTGASSVNTPTETSSEDETATSSEAQKIEPQGEKIEFNVSDLFVDGTDGTKMAGFLADGTNWEIVEGTDKNDKHTYEIKKGMPNKSTTFSFNNNEIKFANISKNWTVDVNGKNSIINEGVTYTHRIKSGGANPKLEIEIERPALISIETMSSSGKNDDGTAKRPRAIKMENITEGVEATKKIIPELTGTSTMDGVALHLLQYNLPAGTFQFGAYEDSATEGSTTESGGYNIYYVSVHYLTAATPAA